MPPLKGGYSVKLRGATISRLDKIKKDTGDPEASYNRVIQYLIDEYRGRPPVQAEG